MTKNYFTISLILLIQGLTFGQGFSNKSPNLGMVGVSVIPILPSGGGGQIFEGSNDSPHAEFGIGGGLDYWKRYGKSYDTHLGLDLKYQQYHFHFGEGGYNGEFQFLHLSVPASLQFPIPNYTYMFFKLGIALSSSNIIQENMGFVGENKYFTTFKTAWLLYPEILLGVDILEEKTSKFYFRVGVDYTFIPISNMGTYTASVSEDGQIKNAKGTFTPNKFQLKLTIYPIWKKKINILKHGHNCPNPF